MAFSIENVVVTRPPETFRILLHGTSAIGKTSLAAFAPDPVFLQVEDGAGILRISTFGLLKSFADVMEALRVLYNEPHNFLTIVLDSADWFEPLVWAETCRRNRWKTIDDPGFGKGYVAADAVWREFLAALDAVRTKRGMSIILIAHSTVARFESPTTEAYDRHSIKLHKRAAGIVAEAVDCIFFYTYKVNVVHDKTPGFGKEKARGTGAGLRVVYTCERPGYVAKNRYSMPPSIDIPDDPASAWSTLAQYLPSTNHANQVT